MNKSARIDEQWHAVRPEGWGTWGRDEKMHSGEREMLYELLANDENIEALVGGTYRAEQDTNRVGKHNGVAVATDKRVIFVDKGVFGSTEVSEMPYWSIEGITYSTGMLNAGMQITGIGMAGWRIEDIFPKESVRPFVECVRGHIEKSRERLVGPQTNTATAAVSVADEIEKLWALVEKGIITQDEFDTKKKQLLGI